MMLSAKFARSSMGRSKICRSHLSTAASTYVASSDSLPAYILQAPVPEVTTLSNGVTVASVYSSSSQGAERVTVRVTGIGARHDKMGGESALLAAALGGEAGRDFLSLPSLSAAAMLSAPPPADLAAVKAAQVAKVQSLSYASQMMDQLHGTAFQGSALGNPLEGTADSIAAVEDLAFAVAGGSVCVVGTGGGEHGKLVEQAEKALGLLPAAGKDLAEPEEPTSFIGSDVRIRYDSHSTATIAIAFKGASYTSPLSLPLSLLTNLLGSYSTSSGLGINVSPKLCQEVATHELASSLSSFTLNYSDTGLFGVLATAPDNKLDDLMWYTMPNLVRLGHGVSDQEFLRAKAALKTQLLSTMDGDIALGQEVAKQLQTIGRFMPLTELMTRVDELTLEDAKAAAMEVINDQDHALAAVGGIHELPDYNWIRRHSYMLRY